MKAEDLLKKATSEKRKGNIEKAIEILRNALIKAKKDYGFPFGIKECLRLPLYLQAAGKTNEAWKEFHNLLIESIKNKSFSDCSQIHDKMRLFLEREKKYNEAIRHGILSFLYDAINTYDLTKLYNWKTGKYPIQISEDDISKYLIKLLKKIKREDLKENFLNLILEQIKKLPLIEFDIVNSKIKEIIET